MTFRLFGLCLILVSIGLRVAYAWPDSMALEEYFNFLEFRLEEEYVLIVTAVQWRSLWAYAVVGGLLMALSWFVDGVKMLVEALTPRGENAEIVRATKT